MSPANHHAGPLRLSPRHRREHCVTRLGCGNVTVRGMAFSSPQNPPTPPGGGSIARPGTVAEASPSAGWSSSGLLGPPYHLPANLPTAPQSRVAMGTRTEGVSSGRAGPPDEGGGTRASVTASLHSPQIRRRAEDAISRQRCQTYNFPRVDLSGGSVRRWTLHRRKEHDPDGGARGARVGIARGSRTQWSTPHLPDADQACHPL
jgi:hypothetical protein